jgi:Trp operon repressor
MIKSKYTVLDKNTVLACIKKGLTHREIKKNLGYPLAVISRWRNEK